MLRIVISTQDALSKRTERLIPIPVLSTKTIERGGGRALVVGEGKGKVEQQQVSLGRTGWRKTRPEGRIGAEERVGQVGSSFCP